jgi:hypothetical protein
MNDTATNPSETTRNGVEDDPMITFFSAVADAGPAYVVRVARVVEGKRVFQRETFEPSVFSPEALAERYGPGRYFCALHGPKNKYVCGVQMETGADTQRSAGLAGAAPAAPAPAPAPAGFDTAQLFAMMQAQQAQTTQILIALINRPQPAQMTPQDWIAILDKRNESTPVTELISGMREMMEMTGSASDRPAPDPLAKMAAELLPRVLSEAQRPAAPATRAAPAVDRRRALEIRAERARRALIHAQTQLARMGGASRPGPAPGGSSSASGSSMPGSSSSASGSSMPAGSSSASGSSMPGGGSSASGSSMPGGSSSASGSSMPGNFGPELTYIPGPEADANIAEINNPEQLAQLVRMWVETQKSPADCAAVFVSAADDDTIQQLGQYTPEVLAGQLAQWIEADEAGKRWVSEFIAESLQLVEIEPEEGVSK